MVNAMLVWLRRCVVAISVHMPKHAFLSVFAEVVKLKVSRMQLVLGH